MITILIVVMAVMVWIKAFGTNFDSQRRQVGSLAEHPRHSVFHADGGLAILVGDEPASHATVPAHGKEEEQVGSWKLHFNSVVPQKEKWHVPPRYLRSTSAFFALTLS